MKIKHAINWHKGLTAPFILGLMLLYQSFTLEAWVYLALHGTYGLIWLIKDRIYPDKQWEQELPIAMAAVTFGMLGLYWVAPFLLIRSGVEPPLPRGGWGDRPQHPRRVSALHQRCPKALHP